MTTSRGEAKKVVHFCRSPVGGLFRHVCDLIRSQAELGLKVGLICDQGTGGKAADRAIREVLPYCALGTFRLPIHRGIHWRDASVLRSATDIVRTIKPEIIHGHGAKGGAFARLLARRLGTRSVYTPHGGSLHYSSRTPSGLMYLGLERRLKPHTDGLIFESHFSADAYARKVGPLSIPYSIIHNGLNDDEFIPLPPGKREVDFVFVGELRKLKGIDVLLDAAKLLSRQRQMSLLIVGDGPDADKLKSQIHASELASTVKMSPAVFPATRAFARANCVVVPSIAESLPYVVLEAAGAGVPLIASRVGGIPEIFGPYSDGLVPPKDPAALAKAMLAVLENPEEANRLAALLRTRVASLFRIEDMVSATIDLYEKVLCSA